jgi:hypothetical protein
MQYPQGMAEGIYFNLSNEEYHKDPALSHSGMTKVLVSWQDYWVSSCHNPNAGEYKATDAMLFGERSGMLLLEPKKFHAKYNGYGRAPTAAKGIWLSSIEEERIRRSVKDIMSVPQAAAYFEQGYPEVSIFWKDKITGVPLRARIDYLRTFGAIDFKRIAGVGPYAIGKAVKAQGLDIQNFLYLEGIKAAREWLHAMSDSEIEEFASEQGVALDWLCAFRDEEDLLFRFLFQRSTPPYIWKIRELDQDVLIEGANATYEAMKRYKEGLARFGTGSPDMGDGELGTITKFHVPRRDYDYE